MQSELELPVDKLRLLPTPSFTGAGNIKLGRSFDKLLPEEAAARKGADIRKAYVDAIPGSCGAATGLSEV